MTHEGLRLNRIGKAKYVSEDSARHSQERKQWFLFFEQRLRELLPDDLKHVQFQVVGSVEEGLSTKNSDIDIVIRTGGSSRTAEARVRQFIADLLKEMKESEETVYRIEIHEPGNKHLFSAVANFRRDNRK
jgi:predicted nucleotidyltransferase